MTHIHDEHGSVTTDCVDQFLDQINIPNYRWDGSPLTLNFDHLGELSIESEHENIVLALTRPMEYRLDETKMKHVLRSVHFDQALPKPVKAGLLNESNLVFMCSLSRDQQSVNELNASIDLLGHLHQQTIAS